MKRRLLVLGGSLAQLNAINRAREAGHYVIVADRNSKAAGAKLADAFVEVSTFDEPAILQAARHHRADGLLVVATDQPVLVAARVCHRLGLPFPLDPETALLVTNKIRMKIRLSDCGIPTPRFAVIHPGDVTGQPDAHRERQAAVNGQTETGGPAGGVTGPTDAALHRAVSATGLGDLAFPLVIKPPDNQGQRGVSLCRRQSELPDACNSARLLSRQEVVLVEEYYESTEVTVSGWVTDGTVQILAVTDRVTIPSPTSLGVCAAHRFPSAYGAAHLTRISHLTRLVVSAFQIRQGPIYFQMLVGEQGVLVNEVACRIGGAFEDRSLPLVTDVDIVGRAISDSLGQPWPALPTDSNAFVQTHGVFTVPLVYATPGRIAALSDLTPARLISGVHAVEWLQPVGTTINEMRDSSQRVAYAVVSGGSAHEVNRRVRLLWDTLSVSSPEGHEMLLQTADRCLHPPSPDTERTR